MPFRRNQSLSILAGLLAICLYWFFNRGSAKNGLANLRNGDIIFQTSKSSQSKAIQMATHSKWSHCGILANRKGQWYVFEAVQPVRFTPLHDWIKRGERGRYILKRLRDTSLLNTKAYLKLQKEGKKLIGLPYDLAFSWSDNRIYCSELIWKMYYRALGIRLGQLQQLKEFDLSNPLVKAKMQERYGNEIPLNEKVISPEAIFNSPLLYQVN